jgi:hypothetical protein
MNCCQRGPSESCQLGLRRDGLPCAQGSAMLFVVDKQNELRREVEKRWVTRISSSTARVPPTRLKRTRRHERQGRTGRVVSVTKSTPPVVKTVKVLHLKKLCLQERERPAMRTCSRLQEVARSCNAQDKTARFLTNRKKILQWTITSLLAAALDPKRKGPPKARYRLQARR